MPDRMRVPRAWAFGVEALVALLVAMAAGAAVIATSGVDPKYRLAGALAIAGFAVLAALPERRIACVVLWVLIHPLGIEKVVFIDAAESQQFINPSVVFNMSDGPLLLLALFTLAETVLAGRVVLRWSRLTTILSLFAIWSAISYGIHAIYLVDGLVISAPMTLLQDVRLLIFVLLMQSAIRTRGDVILVLLAVAGAIMMQTAFVALSFVTGQDVSYAASTAGTTLQTFDTSGSSNISRATGTVGQVNQQAQFHVFQTIPLVALFVIRNPIVRIIAALVIGGSAIAIVLTYSRGAWLTFPLGLMTCGAIAAWRGLVGRAAVIAIGGCTIVATLGLLVMGQPIVERLTYGDSGATDSRLRMLELAKDLFEQSPMIGVGPGEFVEAALRRFPPGQDENQWVVPGERLPYPPPTIGRVDIAQIMLLGIQVRRPLPVHNKYMLLLAELGVPGLLLWLWFYGEFVIAAWRCSNLPDVFLKLVGVAGIGAALAQIVYMNVDLFTEDKPLEIMLFVAAFVVAASRCKVRSIDNGIVP